MLPRPVRTLLLLMVLGLPLISEAADTSKICSTDVCKKTAQIFKASMNPNVHPCNNFYNFACGNFMSRVPLPRGKNMIGPFYEAHETQQANLKIIMNQATATKFSSAENKAIQFYRTCLNSVSSLSQRTSSMNFLKQMLTDLISGWPLTSRNWNSRNFDLTVAMARIASQLDQGFFLSPMILPDMADSSRYTITMIPQNPAMSSFPFTNNVMKTPEQLSKDPITGLPRDSRSNYQQQNLVGVIREIACIIDPNCASNPYLYRDVMTLNNMLTRGYGYSFNNPEIFVLNKLNLHTKGNYAVDPSVEDIRFSISGLNRVLPQIDWQTYFEILLENTDLKVDSSLRVLAVYDQLGHFLYGFEQLTDREKALFLGWHIVVKYGKLFSQQLRAVLSPGEDQSDVCLDTVNQLMGYAVGSLYNQKHVPNATLNEVNQIVRDLKTSFRGMLEENTWMDSISKKTALKKIDIMGESVGAPDWIINKEKLDQYYSKFTSQDAANLPAAFKKAKILQFAKQAERLKRPVNRKDDWPIEMPAMTNAMYYMPSNFMYFGSGMLQFPFYVYGLPRAVNFGSFGYVAGHEITHGFDTAGGTRNENGEVENWWMSSTAQKFMSKAQCFVEQYGSMEEPTTGMNVNGELTVGENIADNGGIRAAFRAYKNVSNAEGGRLYGLEQYTEDQLFFMSAALTYCTKATPEFMQMLILSDEHSPNMFRALLPLLNSDDFARAFNCPVNSPMNPRSSYKCKLW